MTRGLRIAPRAALQLALLALALGCVAPPSQPVQPPTQGPHPPGAKLLGGEADVVREYECAANGKPRVMLEESALRPTPLAAGAELGHRIVYALCPARARQALAGKLRTRIAFGGATVVDDSAAFSAQPGRWAVDTLIALPPNAKLGAYELEVTFTPVGGAVGFATKMPFSVWKK